MKEPALVLEQYKVVVLGGNGSIVLRLRKGNHIEFDPTRCERELQREMEVDGEKCLLTIVDPLPVEEYRVLTDTYCRQGKGFLLVYGVNDHKSFIEVAGYPERVARAKDCAASAIPFVVVGNCERGSSNHREVTCQEGTQLAKAINCPFLEASLAVESNLNEAFHKLVRAMRDKKRGPKASREVIRGKKAKRMSLIHWPQPQKRPGQRKETFTILEDLKQLRRVSSPPGILRSPRSEEETVEPKQWVSAVARQWMVEDEIASAKRRRLQEKTRMNRQVARQKELAAERRRKDEEAEKEKEKETLGDMPFTYEETEVLSPRRIITTTWEEIQPESIKYMPAKEGCLGQGGYGRVQEARWRGHKVAVKLIYEGGSEDDTRLAVRKEAAMLASVRSPYLVQLMGACTENRPFLIVTELVECGSLADLLKKNQGEGVSLSLQEIKELSSHLLIGLIYLHDLRIVHRDLKPSNILISGEGRYRKAKIADFGCARVESEVTMTGETGTIAYMAPEVIRKAHYGSPADMFSFGIILYELTFGINPFRSQGYLAPAAICEGRRPEFPNGWEARCPLGLRQLIESCWAQDPKTRPTAAEALDALENTFS